MNFKEQCNFYSDIGSSTDIATMVLSLLHNYLRNNTGLF